MRKSKQKRTGAGKVKVEATEPGHDDQMKTGDTIAAAQPAASLSPTIDQEHTATAYPATENKADISQSSSPETEMEVHHHPQLEHKHKPWKEYLLEGFMIFIAVMMGFIAENIRESITNSEHVRHLTAQLVQDLKTDTTLLNEVYQGQEKIVRNNDTLSKLLQVPLEKADTKRIQQLLAASHSLWLFHPSAGAISAIKNELHLKQFSNSKIISYFATYEKHIELLHTAEEINLRYQRSYLDPFITQHFTAINLAAAFNGSPVSDTPMRDISQHNFEQLAAEMVLLKINNDELLRDNRKLNADADSLMEYVINQYHPEE